MKKLGKLTLKNAENLLEKDEMKNVVGGYGYSNYDAQGNWYGWKCYCTSIPEQFMASGSWEDIRDIADHYCRGGDYDCMAVLK